jgi:imidazolonepropionase
MPVLNDISTVYTCRSEGGQSAVFPIQNAAVAWSDGHITWVGPASDLPSDLDDGSHFSAAGQIVIPGLVDCHTHLAFGGWRADEFEQRIRGDSYLDIARAGGGIRKTMQQTRTATYEELLAACRLHLEKMSHLGVTTVECKSGYGLNETTERKILEVYRTLKDDSPMEIVSTFLGAHIVPPEFKDNREAYIEILCKSMIPAFAAEGLAEFCDVFVEESAFTHDEAIRILEAGKMAGLTPKLHVDQLHDGGGAALAAQMDAVSADHLEYTGSEGIRKMRDAGVIGVCLPLATLYLNQRPMPARQFVEGGVKVAVATDFNPGSAPSYHLPLAMMLACTMNRLTPAEVLKGATIYAAEAIHRGDRCGSIEPGKRADFAVLDVPNVNHWMYHFESDVCSETFIKGIPCHRA